MHAVAYSILARSVSRKKPQKKEEYDSDDPLAYKDMPVPDKKLMASRVDLDSDPEDTADELINDLGGVDAKLSSEIRLLLSEAQHGQTNRAVKEKGKNPQRSEQKLRLSLRPCRQVLDEKEQGSEEELVSMRSACSLSRVSNWSITCDLLQGNK
ncbi:UNVERIFIED_CONTAM: hypothetical protein FKN15_070249 [Acipenser sinensis]